MKFVILFKKQSEVLTWVISSLQNADHAFKRRKLKFQDLFGTSLKVRHSFFSITAWPISTRPSGQSLYVLNVDALNYF